MTFAAGVYALCAISSGVCAWLLARGYARTRARLLLWSCLCFCALFANNIVLFLDLALFPGTNLLWIRQLTGFAGAALLLYGLVWDSGD